VNYFFLGIFTGLSLILAIGPQNIFVIEQGLKKQFVFIVCLICSLSDTLLIFIGIVIFGLFQKFFISYVEFILNFLLILFLIYFIWKKWNEKVTDLSFDNKKTSLSVNSVILKTLGFTYLNAHVYSDTVFFLGNFSKNFHINQKIFFGIGASISSFIFFFLLGYLASYFSKYLKTAKVWKVINKFIICFMVYIIILIFIDL